MHVSVRESSTDLSVLVQLIVCQLDLLKGDDLLPQLLASVGCVGMGVEPVRRGGVSLASHQPGRPVVGVAVALVVAGHDVQEHPVLSVWPQILKAASDSGKHPPVERKCSNSFQDRANSFPELRWVRGFKARPSHVITFAAPTDRPVS